MCLSAFWHNQACGFMFVLGRLLGDNNGFFDMFQYPHVVPHFVDLPCTQFLNGTLGTPQEEQHDAIDAAPASASTSAEYRFSEAAK